MLYVIPNFIADTPLEKSFPSFNIECIKSIKHFAVENPKEARSFLKKTFPQIDFNEISFYCIGKKGNEADIEACKEVLKKGEVVGLVSDAGMPGVADPGKEMVAYAHKQQIPVQVLVGPSSILHALAGSGLNGQNFHFHGYLPVEPSELRRDLKKMEMDSLKNSCTHIFIETPYRNQALLKQLTQSLSMETQLCIAANLTADDQWIKTKTVDWWKKNIPDLQKIPCVFLFST